MSQYECYTFVVIMITVLFLWREEWKYFSAQTCARYSKISNHYGVSLSLFLVFANVSISHNLRETRWDGWAAGLWQLYRVFFKEPNGLVAPESVSHDHLSQIQCSQMKEQGLQQKQ